MPWACEPLGNLREGEVKLGTKEAAGGRGCRRRMSSFRAQHSRLAERVGRLFDSSLQTQY